ncbi:hypothetical protein N3C_1535 [Clostridium sp. N3C]|uniref:hypothetical protein n=1 Tax=Clostridium sp. N3C TaxID=1776758 RepID=UPI00092E1A8A|nr:hypothetical protein [Clostridium sp. N3C]SCN23866.1 hypothetical protein N3C_1535 [Clostridium sp. N3C]
MLYNFDIKIAVKNSNNCYKSYDFSIFELESISDYLPDFNATINSSNKICIRYKCPICGEEHENNYNIKDFFRKQLIIGGCDITGSPVYFVGQPIKVSKYISKYNEINSKVYAML